MKSQNGYFSLVDRGNGNFLLLCRFSESYKAYKVVPEIDRSKNEVVLAAERTVYPDYKMMENALNGVQRKVCKIEDLDHEAKVFLANVPSHIPRDHLHIEEHTYSSGETLRFFSFIKGYSLWCSVKEMYLGKQSLSCGRVFKSGNVCLYDDPENYYSGGMGLKIMVWDQETKKHLLLSVDKPWSNESFWHINVHTEKRWSS